jgi:hypothetical protein
MRVRKTLFALCFVNLFCLSFLTCKSQSNEDIHVVLLAGQSNMAGAGNYEELDNETKKRIEAVSNRVSVCFNGKKAKPLSYYDNKPSEKYNFLKRFGPELLMGLTLAEVNPNQEYLLIKTSQGGTALYGAWNPNWSGEKAMAVEKGEMKQKIKLYEKHVVQIHKELTRLKAGGNSYKIIGLAWMQGENDAVLIEAATSYKENLENLISSYRNEFNLENMPFIAGQTNSHYGVKGGSDIVRKAFIDVEKSVAHVDIIETLRDSPYSDFPKHTDDVHYNTEGQKRLGIAFAKALLSFKN